MSGNHPGEFKKRSLLIISVDDETVSVVAMCVSNEGRSPVTIHGCHTAPTPTGFAEIISDDFLILHIRTAELIRALSVPFPL